MSHSCRWQRGAWVRHPPSLDASSRLSFLFLAVSPTVSAALASFRRTPKVMTMTAKPMKIISAQPKPFSTGAPDPNCRTGIRAGRTCCPLSCGQCGGKGCDKFPGGGTSCCVSTIKLSGVSCLTTGPPCTGLNAPTALPSAAPTVKSGITFAYFHS
jgi:hypothetical protein